MKVLVKDRTSDKIVLKVSQNNDNDNEIIIRLYPNKEGDERQKVEMTVRRKFAPTDDIGRYPHEVKWFAELSLERLSEASPFRKWIKSNYISLPIPLIPERNGGKIYFRTLIPLSIK